MNRQALAWMLSLLCAGALWAQPHAIWNPTELDFGTVGLNQVAVRYVFIFNGGRDLLTVDVSLSGEGFSRAPAEPTHYELQPRDSGEAIQVMFAPSEEREYTGELVLDTNDPNNPHIVVPLTGIGGEPPPPPPEGFHLLRPENGEFVELPITFEWEPAPLGDPVDPPEYVLYIAGDSSNGGGDILEFAAGQNTTFIVTEINLPPSRFYAWWVVASWNGEREQSEDVWIFYMDGPPPPPPPHFGLLQPGNNDTLISPEIAFAWEAIEDQGATYTLFILGPDSNRYRLHTFDTGHETSFVVSAAELDGDGTYLWYVYAHTRDFGDMASEQTWSFILLADANSHMLAEDPAASAVPSRLDVAVYPNPFNSQASITLFVPVEGHVRAQVFDVLGREVALLNDGALTPGEHRLTWRAEGPSGLYILRVNDASGSSEMRRLMFIK